MFDFNNVNDFDRHISLSIPSYDVLCRTIVKLADYFIRKDAVIYDLGCSTGKHLHMMKKINGAKYYGVDNSELLPGDSSDIHFIKDNIINVDYEKADLFLSIFTLQFLTKSERESMIDIIASKLKHHGALIVAEKTYYSDGKVQSITESVHKEMKNDNFTWQEIMNKEEQLRENMQPLRNSELVKELRTIGEPFEIWRCFHFVAYIVMPSVK